MEHAFKSPADWLVDHLSGEVAKCSGRPRDEIAARIVEGMQSGALATEVWVVGHLDGTRLPELGFTRSDFFSWCVWAGGLDIDPKDHDQVWPPTIFKDNRIADIDRLVVRWKTHAGGYPAPDINDALWAAISELAVFRWSQMDLSVGRDNFAAWYKASPLSSTQSVIANTIRPVSVDDLWPAAADKEPWTNMSLKEAVNRAYEREYPGGLPAGTSIKRRNVILSKRLEQHGVRTPDERSFRRHLNERSGR